MGPIEPEVIFSYKKMCGWRESPRVSGYIFHAGGVNRMGQGPVCGGQFPCEAQIQSIVERVNRMGRGRSKGANSGAKRKYFQSWNDILERAGAGLRWPIPARSANPFHHGMTFKNGKGQVKGGQSNSWLSFLTKKTCGWRESNPRV